MHVLVVVFALFSKCSSAITDEEYARMPEVFHLDNYDLCLSINESANYCSITFQLEPFEGESDVFDIIQAANADGRNYRHDRLRHGVCVPLSCPNVEENDLERGLESCYNEKYRKFNLKGRIKEIRCETRRGYQFDWFDKLILFITVFYTLLIFLASFLAKNSSNGSISSEILSALSLSQNWNRLHAPIKSTSELESLKCIQGFRAFHMFLVVFAHSALMLIVGPISNTPTVEKLGQKPLTLLMQNNSICIATFFLISKWLMTFNLLRFFEQRKCSVKILAQFFAKRFLRLTPLLAVVILLNSTLIVHLFRGPLWDDYVAEEYRNCRRNWWTNLLYINNFIDQPNMCMLQTWYLALDTQYYIISLLIIYLMVKHPKRRMLILFSFLIVGMVMAFGVNYVNGFSAVWVPNAEGYYRLADFKRSQFFHQATSVFTNSGGPAVGMMFGYWYYKYHNAPIFTRKIYSRLFYAVIILVPLGISTIPGYLTFFRPREEKHLVWASLHTALSRPIFALGIGVAIFGISKGKGWVLKYITESPSMLVLGRISYSVYLVHLAVVRISTGINRSPVFINNFVVFSRMTGDVAISFLVGFLLTLFVEMPIKELQDIVFRRHYQNNNTDERKTE